MNIQALDHIVLVVADTDATCAFYETVLGLQPVWNLNGKRALKFGQSKINLQVQGSVPSIASRTTRGSANFCLVTATPIDDVIAHLKACEVEIIAGPDLREGAIGRLLSVYFYDIDGNLVEVANRLDSQQ